MARITIRRLTLATVETIISTAALSGLVLSLLGSASCFLGLSGAGTIELAKLLKPHRQTLKVMMFYGGVGVGSGLFLIGTGMVIADYIRSPIETEELFSQVNESQKCSRPSACVGCKHFNGSIYNGVQLICAVHPYGCETEQCQDWEK